MAAARKVIAGLSGELVSQAYAEQELLPSTSTDTLHVFERQLLRWWRGVSRTLGPTSSARAVLDIALGPLLSLLGHSRPVMSPHPHGLSGKLEGSGIGVLALPWSVPIRTAYRGTRQVGLAASAEWAIACNGQALGIVDCTRPWTRARVEFDFDRLLATSKGIAMLWLLANAAAALRTHVAASDAHTSRVCGALGDGVLEALPRLAAALAPQRPRPSLDQALTLIYRILFLLFAEARGMVPIWHQLYRDAYSLEMLTRKAGDPHARGLWPALQAISRLAHAGCKAADLEVTPFNGRLFSPRHAPLVEQRRRVDEGVIREVLLKLATEPTRQGRRRISYHDLGVEQLGSVYERVLEHEHRKSTGSFYTPRSITEFLVRQTLAPLVEGKSADDILALRVLDPAMGSGAFLVAACRYLADQCEVANVNDGRWVAGGVTAADRSTLRRLVAERCLYGVDANPTAVQLARLSMWLTTLAADRPVTFLDHHLAIGNSLVGAQLADLGRPPRGSRPAATLPLFEDQLASIMSAHVLPARLQLALTPSDSIDAVKHKERVLSELSTADGPFARWSLAADAWCAALLSRELPPPGLVVEWMAAATGAPTTLPAARLHASLGSAIETARRHGAFHWQLAFPEIFIAADGQVHLEGGFDAVIGNPPWGMVRGDPALRFYTGSHLYSLQGHGHTNLYQLFLERALRLARPGGRIGLILPSGLATDHGSAALRRHLFDRTAVDTWLGFDNRRGIFPIHRSMRFVLLCTTTAGRTKTLKFRCGLVDTAALNDAADSSRALTIARSRLETWSPDLSVPEVPDATALGILSGIASRVPALGDASGWNLRFGRELNATDDRPHFLPLAKTRQRLLPIVEGKLLSPFQVHLDRATTGIPARTASRLLDREPFRRPRLAYRDVAGATNKLTLIAALLPAGTVSTHTVFVSKTPLDEESQWCLLGLMNSLVANYLVRLRVMTHVTTATMARLPLPRPAAGSPPFETLASISRQLSVRGINEGADDYARLNAIGAQLYGLTCDQFGYLLSTFPLIATDVRDSCLDAFHALTRKHGNS
ncbi:MAG: Eco57I restriction-modification methylase domain-containing protein [Vicinamibacterales bacterium]